MSHNDNIHPCTQNSSAELIDFEAIKDFLSAIHPSGNFELCAFPPGGGCNSVVCSIETAGEAFRSLYNDVPDATGFYCSVNPTNRPKCSRATRQRSNAGDIPRRTHLLVDIDGCKNGKTPEERERLRRESIELAKRISGDLTSKGWSQPVMVNSGNGAQMWYRIDEPTNSDLVPRTLKALSAKYDTGELHIDLKVADAARPGRLPGTWNRKKDYPSDEHRRAVIVSMPDPDLLDDKISLTAIPHDALEALAKDIPAVETAQKMGDKIASGVTDLNTESHKERFITYLQQSAPPLIEGSRNNTITAVAAKAGDFGLTDAELIESLMIEHWFNREGNDAIDDMDEVSRTIKSALRSRRNEIGCDTAEAVLSMFDDGKVEPVSTSDKADETQKTESDGDELYKEISALLLPGQYFYDRATSEKPDCWVDKRIPVGDYLAEIFGAPGCGKSILVHQLCICILNGLPFWGYETKRVAANGRVFKPLIIACEEDKDAISRHIKAQVDILCNGDGEKPDVLYLNGTDHTSFFTVEKNEGKLSKAFNEVVRVIKDKGYNFIVVDNRLETFGNGDENRKEQAGGYYSLLQKECVKGGFQILMLAHSNKQGNESGCTGFAAKLRLHLKAVLKENNTTEIFVAKENFSIPRDPWGAAKLYTDENGDKRDVFLMTSGGFSEAEQLDKIVEIVEAAGPDGIGRQELRDQMKNDPLFNDNDITKLIGLAKDRGLIVQKTIDGVRKWRITAEA